jgi:hypothetical protein
MTSSDRTPFWRMLAKSIGSIVYLVRSSEPMPGAFRGQACPA